MDLTWLWIIVIIVIAGVVIWRLFGKKGGGMPSEKPEE